jgi:capsular exopolysaccharide synthesis family protein
MNTPEVNETSETNLNLMQYVYLFWQWAWVIALACVLAAGSAYVVSKRTTPVYQTSTRLLISDPPGMNSINYSQIVTSPTMAMTYSKMLTDRPVLQGVIDELKLSVTPEKLAEVISVELVTNTQLVTISVEDTDPAQAVKIADSIARVFAVRISQLQAQRYSTSRQGLEKQVTDMEAQLQDTTAAIATETDPNQKVQLESRLTQYRQLYSNLVTSYEQVRLAEAQTTTNVVVSEPAALPLDPIRPKTMQNTLLAGVVGVLLAMGGIFAVDALDDTFKNPDEIRQRFNLPILGMIASHPPIIGKTISQDQPRSPVTESFRALRTNITFAGVDRPIRRVLVTSATPQDGKTTVSTNLAVVLAQGEKTVVLIDGDMRRPQIHARFGLPNKRGLSDLFVNSVDDLSEYTQSCGVPHLTLITSGAIPPNPAELLTSKKMVQILDRLNQDHDLVLIDTPPVLSVTDAAALAPGMDGVILVARPGSTKLGAFSQTVEQLRGVGARILGVVLNDVEPKSRKYGYYYNRYYSKYAYYYSADGTKKVKKGKKNQVNVAEKNLV